jgi:DNA polymerase-3 subunit alpha
MDITEQNKINNLINEQSKIITGKFIRKCPDNPEYKERLERELKLIIEKKFVDYILKICDILDLIKRVPHIIRGSSGSSLTCYLLGITDIDPVKERISFARFLNEYRNSMPDIDMDFPHNRRDKIFTQIFEKWDNVVRISNHVLYKQKSAVRQALKDMGISGRVSKTKCNLNYFSDPDKKKELGKRVNELKGQLKNYSLHCGGIIFYSDPKQITKDKIKDRQVSWNKVDTERKGFFKIDILSNRGLSQLFGIDSKPLLDYDFTDSKTIELLQSGKNIGLTFAESPAMRKIMTTFKPKSVQDIAICLAAIRPGASKSEADTIEDLNNNIVFDDDAIYYIKDLLKCDEDTADSIRRLYSKGDKVKIGQFELELFASNPNLDIDEISDKLVNLRKYSFCKSHALSYAYLVWALAYQKAHNPQKFWQSTISNCSSMYRSWVHIREAILSGVEYTGNKKLSNIGHFYKYGYWLGENFIDPDMYVDITNESKLTCVFRGLIACGRWYKRFNSKTKKYDLVTFITIGYKNSIYIDLTVEGWKSIKEKNVCSGEGKLLLSNGYASIKVAKIDYE